MQYALFPKVGSKISDGRATLIREHHSGPEEAPFERRRSTIWVRGANSTGVTRSRHASFHRGGANDRILEEGVRRHFRGTGWVDRGHQPLSPRSVYAVCKSQGRGKVAWCGRTKMHSNIKHMTHSPFLEFLLYFNNESHGTPRHSSLCMLQGLE